MPGRSDERDGGIDREEESNPSEEGGFTDQRWNRWRDRLAPSVPLGLLLYMTIALVGGAIFIRSNAAPAALHASMPSCSHKPGEGSHLAGAQAHTRCGLCSQIKRSAPLTCSSIHHTNCGGCYGDHTPCCESNGGTDPVYSGHCRPGCFPSNVNLTEVTFRGDPHACLYGSPSGDAAGASTPTTNGLRTSRSYDVLSLFQHRKEGNRHCICQQHEDLPRPHLNPHHCVTDANMVAEAVVAAVVSNKLGHLAFKRL